MDTVLPNSEGLGLFEAVTLTPADAIDRFNKDIKRSEDKLSVQSIKDITKDIYYSVDVETLSQARTMKLVTSKNTNNATYSRPTHVSDPWEVKIPVDPEYKNFSETHVVNESKHIVNCSTCNGSGETTCHKCNGQGQLLCPKCKGVNSLVETTTAKKKGVVTRGLVGAVVAGPIGMVLGAATGKKKTITSSQVCPTCFGKGTLTCQQCRGQGISTCGQCAGAGNLVQYQEIHIKNLYSKKHLEINNFRSNAASKYLAGPYLELEFEGNTLEDGDLDVLPESEQHKLKDILTRHLNAQPSKVLKFRTSIASTPVFKVAFEHKGKSRDFKIVGTELVIEKAFIDSLINLFSLPSRLYASFMRSSLPVKVTICIVVLLLVIALLFLIIR